MQYVGNTHEIGQSLPGLGVGWTVDGTVVGFREEWMVGTADEGSDDWIIDGTAEEAIDTLVGPIVVKTDGIAIDICFNEND